LPSFDHLTRWWQDGGVAEAEKTEKITINLGLVDLGRIDLLVQEGFYANRTDFIRAAVRAQLATHGDALQRTVERKTLADDVTPELALATIESVEVLGAFRASTAVKAALRDRTR
jgi:Arc/MetJ-type ribon-helix-helix transcriptional regulator